MIQNHWIEKCLKRSREKGKFFKKNKEKTKSELKNNFRK
jgi:hypothetical protein